MPTVAQLSGDPLLYPGWHYQEFVPLNAKPTPNDVIQYALMWLGDSNLVPANGTSSILVSADSSGVVRVFYYGTLAQPPISFGGTSF